MRPFHPEVDPDRWLSDHGFEVDDVAVEKTRRLMEKADSIVLELAKKGTTIAWDFVFSNLMQLPGIMSDQAKIEYFSRKGRLPESEWFEVTCRMCHKASIKTRYPHIGFTCPECQKLGKNSDLY